MNKLTRAASGALAALACVAFTVDVGAQGRTGRSGAPGPQGRTGGPAAPPAAANIADDPLSGPVVTNAPFSADAVTTVTQVLSDGTRIEQSTTAKFYRDSTGRVRSEQTVLGLGALGASNPPRTTITVTTTDANGRVTYTLDPVNKTARRGAVIRFYTALSANVGAVTAGTAPAGTAYALTIDAENRERERRAVAIADGLTAVRTVQAADANAVQQPDEVARHPAGRRRERHRAADEERDCDGQNRQRSSDRDHRRALGITGPAAAGAIASSRSAHGRRRVSADQHRPRRAAVGSVCGSIGLHDRWRRAERARWRQRRWLGNGNRSTAPGWDADVIEKMRCRG